MKKNFLFLFLIIANVAIAQKQDTIALKGVTINAAKPFVEMKAGKMILNMANSPLTAGSNVLEVLQMAPGVQVDQNGRITYNGKPVTVYLEGRPSYLNTEALKALLTGTQGQNIDKIELISNPSAKYDAAGGAMINIKMKKEKGLGLNGNVTVGMGHGDYFRTNESVFLNYRAKKLNVYGGYDLSYGKRSALSTSERNTPDFSIPGNGAGVNTSQSHNFRSGLDYNISSRSSFGFTLNAMYNEKRSASNQTSRFYSKSLLPDSTLVADNNGTGGFFTPAFNAYFTTKLDTTGKELTINGDYYTFNTRSRQSFDTRSNLAAAYLLRHNSPQEIGIRSLSADYKQPHWEAGLKTIFIKTNTDTRWEEQTTAGWKPDSGKSNHFIYREWINAAYVNYAKDWKKWGLQAGLRLENTRTKGHSLTTGETFTKNYTRLFPNVALQYTLNDDQQFSFSYRKSINRPSYAAVNPFLTFESKYAYFRGNPDLGPEMAHAVELSHVLKGALFTTLSYMRYNGVVSEIYEQDPKSMVLYNSYSNLSYSEWFFAGISYTHKINSWWSNNTSLQGGYIRYNYDTVALQRSTPGFFFSTINTFTVPKVCMIQAAFNYSSRVSSGLQEMKDYWGVNLAFQRSIWEKKMDLKLNFTDIFRTMQMGNISDYRNVRINTIHYNDNRAVTFTMIYRFGDKNVKANRNRKSGIESEKGRISR